MNLHRIDETKLYTYTEGLSKVVLYKNRVQTHGPNDFRPTSVQKDIDTISSLSKERMALIMLRAEQTLLEESKLRSGLLWNIWKGVVWFLSFGENVLEDTKVPVEVDVTAFVKGMIHD